DKGNWPALAAQFEEIFASRTQEEWIAAFEGVDACVSPVLSFSEARKHPHLQARNGFVPVGDLVQPAPTPRLDQTPANVGEAPMGPGEGRRSVLERWGLTTRNIEVL